MQRGCPIRTPSDHRPFTNSPRLIAGHHVLHRLLIPRHPPCALTHSPHFKNRAANQITHNNKQSRRSFIRCSRPLFTNKNNNKKNTQQSVPPQPNNVPTRTLHAPSKEHTTHAHNTPQKAHHESFCDVPPKNKHHTQRMVYPPKH